MKKKPSSLPGVIKSFFLRSSDLSLSVKKEAAQENQQNSTVTRLTNCLSDEENMKIRQIKEKVVSNQNTSQTRSKMKGLYFERILHDFIMLNPGISVSELFSHFEQKPLYISKFLKILENKGRIVFESSNEKNFIWTKKNDFANNLILKKIEEKDASEFLQLIDKLNDSEIMCCFKKNRLSLHKEDKSFYQIVIDRWIKI